MQLILVYFKTLFHILKSSFLSPNEVGGDFYCLPVCVCRLAVGGGGLSNFLLLPFLDASFSGTGEWKGGPDSCIPPPSLPSHYRQPTVPGSLRKDHWSVLGSILRWGAPALPAEPQERAAVSSFSAAGSASLRSKWMIRGQILGPVGTYRAHLPYCVGMGASAAGVGWSLPWPLCEAFLSTLTQKVLHCCISTKHDN